MTEKERMEIVFGIRPKLKAMNKKLQRLTKAVKYTSMGDIWLEIDEGARPTESQQTRDCGWSEKTVETGRKECDAIMKPLL
jgi:hypothetical protein